jgi:hypothetical protein
MTPAELRALAAEAAYEADEAEKHRARANFSRPLWDKVIEKNRTKAAALLARAADMEASDEAR